MKLGKLNPQGAVEYDGWEKIYETELSSPTSSVSITGLNGNTDEQYMLDISFKSINGERSVLAYLNNDTASNYGRQILIGVDSTISASRAAAAGIFMCYAKATGTVSQGTAIIHAKSGYVRTCLNTRINSMSGTTATEIQVFGQSWNNTANKITSIVISDGGNSSMSTGTIISLYRRITA